MTKCKNKKKIDKEDIENIAMITILLAIIFVWYFGIKYPDLFFL